MSQLGSMFIFFPEKRYRLALARRALWRARLRLLGTCLVFLCRGLRAAGFAVLALVALPPRCAWAFIVGMRSVARASRARRAACQTS